MKQTILVYVLLLILSAGMGVGLGIANARFGIAGTTRERATIAIKSFLLPDHFVNSSRGAGTVFPLDDCSCRRVGWQCPCSSVGIPDGPEKRVLTALLTLPEPVHYGPTEDFKKTLISATGYDRIEAAIEPVIVGRKDDYLGGELREMFFRYDTPSFLVRALALTHNDNASRSLFLHTPASWTTAEVALGIGDPMYLREVGKHLFQAGHDVVSLDHGSNGHMETAFNGYTLTTAGVQAFGLWARSTCDAALFLKAEGRTYERVVVYGLSRGNRTIEYIRGLCPEIDIAFGDDTFFPDGLVNAYWRSNISSLVHSTKYGAWFLHGETLIGRSTAHDMITVAAKPRSKLVLFVKRKDFLRKIHELELSFSYVNGIRAEAPVYIVEKRIDRHQPENESLVDFLAGNYGAFRAVSLFPKPGTGQ